MPYVIPKCYRLQTKRVLKVFTTMFLKLIKAFFYLLLDPAVSTIQNKFQPTNCTTLRGEFLEGNLEFIKMNIMPMTDFVEGKNNCFWSSCREGCTKEIYTCWQVTLISIRWTKNNLAPATFIQIHSVLSQIKHGHLPCNIHGRLRWSTLLLVRKVSKDKEGYTQT